MRRGQQGACSLGLCGRWKLTCSPKDIGKGVGDKVRFSGTWVSFHTRLVQSIYSVLAGVTAPQRFWGSSLPQGLSCSVAAYLHQAARAASLQSTAASASQPNSSKSLAGLFIKHLSLWTDATSIFPCLSLPAQPGTTPPQPGQGLP